MGNNAYKLAHLANGAVAVHSIAYGETMHPGPGPVAEAETLYVQQLKIRERMREQEEFVVWDIGLGAAANALTTLRATREIPCPLQLVSFDNTSEPLSFALCNAEALGYFNGYKSTVAELMEQRVIEFQNGASRATWEFHPGDFPALLASDEADAWPKPHAIMFDAFSPRKNPAMWTLPVFTRLFQLLDPARPCALSTYSRSTAIRATLSQAGFLVGRGLPVGMKEETTIAANTAGLIAAPLDRLP